MNYSDDRLIIIAEVGVNHNGDLKLAKQIVDSIAETDADIIKFQTVIPELLMVTDTPKAKYQEIATDSKESAFEMISRLTFNYDEFVDLKEYVEKTGKEFLSTAFDHESLEFLSNVGLTLFKIPSGEITNLPYLRDVANRASEIILSTGMSDLEEVKSAVSAIVETGFPLNKITVLQCNTSYPTPIVDTNLNAMVTMGNHLGTKFGFSDHTEGETAAIVAVALGAAVIEKHVTFSKRLPGPDQSTSMEPEDFDDYVNKLREAKLSLGSLEKFPTTSESPNRHIARRGTYFAKDIEKGQMIEEMHLVCLRPENNFSPMDIDSVIGKTLKVSVKRHDSVNKSQFIENVL